MSLTCTSWYRNTASCFHLFAFRLGRGLNPGGRGQRAEGRGLEGLLAEDGLLSRTEKSRPTGNQEHEA